MTLYLVREGEREVSLATERDGFLYTYDNHTEAFHRNEPLTRDWLVDQELQYVVVDIDEAQQVLKRGAINIDARTMGSLVAAHRADKAALARADVLGRLDIIGSRTASVQRAGAITRTLLESPPGRWVDWRTYDADKLRTAYVAASDLRTGKNKSFAELGPIQARVTSVDDRHIVQVARAQQPEL